jgi:hypothetical protein
MDHPYIDHDPNKNQYYQNNSNTDDLIGVNSDGFYIFFGFIAFIIALIHICRCCNVGTNRRSSLRQPIRNPEEIEKKTILFETDSSPKTCSICLENYKPNEPLIQLQCNHIYHPDCINDWLRRQSSCPLCRCDFI